MELASKRNMGIQRFDSLAFSTRYSGSLQANGIGSNLVFHGALVYSGGVYTGLWEGCQTAFRWRATAYFLYVRNTSLVFFFIQPHGHHWQSGSKCIAVWKGVFSTTSCSPFYFIVKFGKTWHSSHHVGLNSSVFYFFSKFYMEA